MSVGPEQRASMLREMGLAPLWRLRGPVGTREEASAPAADKPPSIVQTTGVQVTKPVPAETAPPPTLPRVALPAVHAVDVPPRDARPEVNTGTHSTMSDRVRRIATLEWNELESGIRECRACVLCERRKQAVPGVGDRQARWMLVGEGPGAEEDLRGEPFVGQAGKLLDNMLAALGLKRGADVYIANAVKCRPPHNRTPEAGEVASCLPYLARQIELVRPRLLIALGRPAAQALLDMEVRIGAARGRLFQYRDIPVIVTYHPAYLLRNPADKAKAWEDLCFAQRTMDEGVGDPGQCR